MDTITTLLQATVQSCVAPDALVSSVALRAADRATPHVRVYDVCYTQLGCPEQTTLVIKDAAVAERQTQGWLYDRGLAVPYCYTPDATTPALAPLCMQYIAATPPATEQVGAVAQALAAIHHAALGRAAELPWLSPADPQFLADWLIDACWRRGWQSVLAGEGHIDAFGRHYGPPKPGGDFAAAFAAYTQPLEAAAARLLDRMAELWAAGDTLTLIHFDFHRDHLRFNQGQAVLIDWGQAHYGPLALDLPNYFSREQVLLYREALAALGHVIAPARLLAQYDAARAYVGFKYFGIGLAAWCYGDPPHRAERVQYWIDQILTEVE